MAEIAAPETTLDPGGPLPLILAPLILALDTSSRRGSLALLQGSRPLALFGVETSLTHSTRLVSEIEMLMTTANLELNQVNALATVTGPGSFTGLRIGLAAAKGLARAIDRQVVGVSSLEATARAAGAGDAVLALINAMRQEVYAQLFRVTEAGEPEALSEPMVGPPDIVLQRFADSPQLTIVGDGIDEYRTVIRSVAEVNGRELIEAAIVGVKGPGWTIAPPTCFLALEAAHIGALRFARGESQAAQDLNAVYVRGADAKLKEKQAV